MRLPLAFRRHVAPASCRTGRSCPLKANAGASASLHPPRVPQALLSHRGHHPRRHHRPPYMLKLVFRNPAELLKNFINGEKWKQMETKFRRRAARTWRVRRPRHIGSPCNTLELPAPCHARLLALSGAAAFGRSGHWQRGLRPRWRLRRPLALCLLCNSLEPGSPISRVCLLASPGRHVRFAQKASSPRGRLILRRAQNSN